MTATPSGRRPLGEPARRALGLAILLALAAACAAPVSQRPADAPGPAPLSCMPSFPYRDGWLGGDGIYSVPLSETETLWLFGDSFIGDPDAASRVGSTLVHNSVGVSRCEEGRWEIDYYWREGADGRPIDLLRAPGATADRWQWLFDGFEHEGNLYLGLLDVERAPADGPLQLPFRLVSTRLARVENPTAPPDRWRVSTLPLWPGSDAFPVAAMVVQDEWLHLFTFVPTEDGGWPRILARLPLRILSHERPDPSRAIEYLARDGSWQPGLDPGRARILMSDNATEMSVRWHASRQRWVAVYSHPDSQGRLAAGEFSDEVIVRTARHLEGPWSEPQPVFRPVPRGAAPPLDPPDPNLACYAAKEPLQFLLPETVTFTYVCNLFPRPADDPWSILERLQREMDVYRPRSVRVPLPSEAPSGIELPAAAPPSAQSPSTPSRDEPSAERSRPR